MKATKDEVEDHDDEDADDEDDDEDDDDDDDDDDDKKEEAVVTCSSACDIAAEVTTLCYAVAAQGSYVLRYGTFNSSSSSTFFFPILCCFSVNLYLLLGIFTSFFW